MSHVSVLQGEISCQDEHDNYPNLPHAVTLVFHTDHSDVQILIKPFTLKYDSIILFSALLSIYILRWILIGIIGGFSRFEASFLPKMLRI